MKKAFLIIFSLLTVTYTSIAQDKLWTLEECIRYAIDNNITIKQQELQTQYQSNTLKQSKLGRLPSLNARGSNNYSFGRGLDEATYTYINESSTNANVSLGANVTLFNGLQTVNTIKSNEYNLEASVRDLDAIKDNISLSVAMGYLQILLNKELVNVTQSQLNTTLEQIEKTSKMVKAGSLARGNLLEIEAQAALEESQLINIENNLSLSYLDLAQFLELETPEGFEIVVPQIEIEQIGTVSDDVKEIYATAEGLRPEIESARLKLKSAEFGLKTAMGARSPRLTMSASTNTRYFSTGQKLIIDPVLGPQYVPSSFGDQFNDNINYGIGLTLDIPIFNGWQVNTGISNSRINIVNSQYVLEGTRKQLYKNIQQAYADAEAALKSYNASTKAVESMVEAFRYSEQKFNVGMVTPVEYNASKTQLLKAQSDLAQAKYQYLFKIKVLDFYRGELLTLNN